MMMKHSQTILAKYCRKGISSIASSPMSTRVKHAWEEQDGLVLGLAFFGGWFVKASINLLKRREDWYRVHRFFDDEKKRLDVPVMKRNWMIMSRRQLIVFCVALFGVFSALSY
ncbi:uncharacterized protein LOC117132188 isoform X1 [Brassica rapa]|uniref:uncharacterized protein LOC117132188 isoform X1 n=1 Tax=Brassica campestris TaxID=3711 RepID=UPI00142DD99B|nr:uncharacterized protein LOC117132188 isoform X1 [Brassica rapa]